MRLPVGCARLVAALLAGLVLAAACGSSDAADQVVATSTTAPPSVSTPEADQPDSVAPPHGGDDPAAPAPPGPDTPTDPGSPAPGATPPTAAPVGPDEPTPAGPVGSLAARYLAPSGAARVLVQVLAQDGAGPRAAVPERVRQVLAQLSGKQVEVAVGGLGGGARAWTSAELRGLADASAPAQSADRAVLTLLFLRGGFAENERAVGVAVRGDVAAVFAERVQEAAGALGSPAAVEDAVTMHEVGHLLGLVDLVLDTGRQDPDHPGHSPNRGSVMYYAVESTLLGSVLSGGPPRDFDQDDLADLARIRNG